MYKVILHKNAVKFYVKSDTKLRQRVDAAIETIIQNLSCDIHIKNYKVNLHHYTVTIQNLFRDLKWGRIF